MSKQKTLSEIIRDEAHANMTAVKLVPSQEAVLRVIEKYHPDGINDKTIAKETGLPHTSVCARRNELVKVGLVESVGYDYFPDHNHNLMKNTLWGLKGS